MSFYPLRPKYKEYLPETVEEGKKDVGTVTVWGIIHLLQSAKIINEIYRRHISIDTSKHHIHLVGLMTKEVRHLYIIPSSPSLRYFWMNVQ